MTLTEFLLARIAEDDDAARYCLDLAKHYPTTEGFSHRWDWALLTSHTSGGGGSQFMRLEGFDPDRVLAECEAKRRIVKWVNQWPLRPHPPSSVDGVLQMLALPYATHPDYRQEWRP